MHLNLDKGQIEIDRQGDYGEPCDIMSATPFIRSGFSPLITSIECNTESPIDSQ